MGINADLRRDCQAPHHGQYPKNGHKETAPAPNRYTCRSTPVGINTALWRDYTNAVSLLICTRIGYKLCA